MVNTLHPQGWFVIIDKFSLTVYLMFRASKFILVTGQGVSRPFIEQGAFSCNMVLLSAPVSLRVSVEADCVDVGAS